MPFLGQSAKSVAASDADELQRAFTTGAHPSFYDDGKRLVLACEELMERGHLQAAEMGMRRVLTLYPDLPYALSMSALFSAEPESIAPLLPFTPEPAKDVQILQREGSDSVVLVFCGQGHKLGMSVPLAHRWLGRLPASLVYFRDHFRLAGGKGYPSLGEDRPSTLAGIRRMIDELGASRVYTYGNSSGSFAAVHYGAELGADATLAMAGPFNFEIGWKSNLNLRSRLFERLRNNPSDYDVDLRKHLDTFERPPRVLVVYGTANSADRVHAEHFGAHPAVELIPIEGIDDHNVIVPTILSGLYPTLLRRWLAVRRADSGASV